MIKLYVIEKHSQLLDLWRKNEQVNLKLVRFDFHCDMRGTLINRRNQQAYRLKDRFPEPDQGNFITHAIFEERIKSIHWIHDSPGGRQYDIGTVKYETDLSMLFQYPPFASRKKLHKALDYKQSSPESWQGLKAGESLDIDWDYFAALEYSVDSIDDRVERFFAYDFKRFPQEIYVCHSPDHCHETKLEFDAFVERLAELFAAEVIVIPQPLPRKLKPQSVLAQNSSVFRQTLRYMYRSTHLTFKKLGIH